MPKLLAVACLVAFSWPRVSAAESLSVAHAGVGCVVAEQFPRFEARIDPAEAVARALVHFRTDAAQPWYAVAMRADEQGGFTAVLPKPKKSLKAFQYYIDATDRAFATSRTAEQTAQVVGSRAECPGKMMAGTLGSVASILLEVPAGAPLVPAGFASAGVAAAAGSGTAAGVAAGGGSGGGIGPGTVAAVVGGGAAAVAGAVIAAKAGSSDGAARLYDVDFPFPGIDVSACAGRNVVWTSQNVSPDGSGHFDTTWAPQEPNLARVQGTVTDTTFEATIACTSGTLAGSLSASGGGGTYQGSFSFGSQRGPITVTRR